VALKDPTGKDYPEKRDRCKLRQGIIKAKRVGKVSE